MGVLGFPYGVLKRLEGTRIGMKRCVELGHFDVNLHAVFRGNVER